MNVRGSRKTLNPALPLILREIKLIVLITIRIVTLLIAVKKSIFLLSLEELFLLNGAAERGAMY